MRREESTAIQRLRQAEKIAASDSKALYRQKIGPARAGRACWAGTVVKRAHSCTDV